MLGSRSTRELVQPLLPIPQRRVRYPGRKRLDDRRCLDGTLDVLVTGIAWEQLPRNLATARG
jgi:transposase